MTTTLKAILKPSRPTGGAATAQANTADSLRTAADNAARAEWNAIRLQVQELAQRKMSPAELGVRLHALLCKSPSLLSESAIGYATPSDGGDDWKDRLRDLLPLPIPHLVPLTDLQATSLFLF